MANPSLDGYLVFLRTRVGIPVEALADDDPDIATSYYASLTLCNPVALIVGTADPAQIENTYFAAMVYYLGAHILITIHLDDPNATPPWNTYWADLRKQYHMDAFIPGLIQSSSDQGTSQSFVVPDWAKTLSPGDLMLMNSPYGRAYIALAWNYGPTIWGLS